MELAVLLTALLITLNAVFSNAMAEDRPYLTTQTPLTLFSTNDGEANQQFQLTEDQTTN